MAENELIFKFIAEGLDKIDKQASELEKHLNQFLKDRTLTVKMDGVKELQEALQGVHQQLIALNKNMGGNAFASINQGAQEAINNLQKLTSTIGELGQQMAHNFTQSFQNELQSLIKLSNEAIAAAAEAQASGKKVRSGTQIADEQKNLASAEVARINKLLAEIQRAESSYGAKFGVRLNSPALEEAKNKLMEIRNVLSQVDEKGRVAVKDAGGNTIFSGKVSDFLKSTTADLSATKTGVSETVAEYKRLELALSQYANMRAKLQETLNKNPNSQYADEIRGQIRAIDQMLAVYGSGRFNNSTNQVRNNVIDINNNDALKTYEQTLKKVAEENRENARAEKEAARAAKERERAQRQAEKAARDRAQAEQKLRNAIDQLSREERRLSGGGPSLAAKAADYRTLINEMRSMLASVSAGVFTDFKGVAFTGLFDKMKTLRSETAALARVSGREIEEEASRIAAGLTKITTAGRLQQYMLSDLRNMAMQYLSVWGASSFVKEMAQITGELQLQQRSLEVIIGSAGKAGELFGEIRDLSQQSPYTFQELLKSTRQLAAFGVQTKDLYGTMKALSDIGAGLSVDVQRLILAYGHVKSYGYLSGIQNRQFETAGVDMVGALTKYYNEMADENKRLGKEAKYVTRKDVFKMISKKDVSFEDVNKVIMDLDKPGGRFYNMQERQFDTLGGKLRNLRNNYNIMMAEMGESSMSLLMGGVNALNKLMENWDKYGKKIAAILIPLGTYKALMLAVNAAMGTQAQLFTRNLIGMESQRLATQNILNSSGFWGGYLGGPGRLAWGGKLNIAGDERRAATYKALETARNNGQISKVDLRRMSLNGRLGADLRYMAATLSGMEPSVARVQAGLKGWARWSALAKLNIRAFGTSLLGMLTGPQAVIMAMGVGIMKLVQHIQEVNSHASDFAKTVGRVSENDAKELASTLDMYSFGNTTRQNTYADNIYSGGKIFNWKSVKFDETELLSRDLTSAIEEMKVKLQGFSPLYDGDLLDIYKFKSQMEQFKAIYEELNRYQNVKRVEEVTASQWEGVIKSTGGWFNDDVIKNMQDYENALHNQLIKTDALSEIQLENLAKKLGVAKMDAEELKDIVTIVAGLDVNSMAKKLKEMFPNNKLKNSDYTLDNLFGLGLNTINIDAEKRKMEDDIEPLVKHMQGVIKSYMKKGDTESAYIYVQDQIKQFMTAASITDPHTQRVVESLILEEITKKMNEGKDGGDADFVKIAQKKLIANELSRMAQESLKLGADPREIETFVDNVFGDIQKFANKNNIDLNLLGINSAKTFKDGFLDGLKNMLTPSLEWQKRFMNYGGTYGDVYENFSKYSDNYTKTNDYYATINQIKKDRKTLIGELETMAQPLKSIWGIEIGLDFKFDKKNFDKIKKIRDELRFRLSSVAKDKLPDKEREQLQPISESFDKYVTMVELLEKEGFDPYADEKNKGGGGRSGQPKDLEAERWRTRIRLITEARRAYDDWMKRYHNSTLAEKKVLEEFGKLAGVDKILKPGDLDNLENYEESLKRIEKEIEARYATDKNNPKRTTFAKTDEQLLIQIRKELEQIDKLHFDEKSERFASSIKRLLDDLTYRWDIFKSIRELTGDTAFAQRASGLTPEQTNGRFQVDSVRDEILSRVGGYVDFDKILSMGDKELEEYVGGLGVAAEEIQSIIELFKDWIRLQKQLYKDSVSGLAKTISEGMTYEEQMRKIDSDLAFQIQSFERLRGTKDKNGKPILDTDINKAIEIAKWQTEKKKWEKSREYYNLMNLATSMSASTFKAALDKERANIINDRTLSPQERDKRLADLHRRERQYGLENLFTDGGSAFGGFLRGGISAAIDALDKKIESGEGTEEDVKRRDSLESWQKGLSKADFVLGGVCQALDGLAEAASSLSEMFDALGNEDAANLWSDIADSISAINSIFKPVENLVSSALSGNIGGVVSSAITSPISMITGPFTAFARLHDKRRERQIEELRKDVQQIDNTLNLIKSLRERALGYDTGSLRRSMYDAYGQNLPAYAAYDGNSKFVQNIVKGLLEKNADYQMQEYYGRGGLQGSGYSQELESMKSQREDYLKMYDLEADKKKKSKETLEEFKSKIAELDEQIMFFVEDLSKELWGIDLKGWAEQLGDALMTAFENGTSAADAFHDSVQDILRSMVKNMLVLGVIEPQLEKLRERLFGENGTFDINDVEGSMGRSLAAVTDFFAEDMPKIVSASKAFYDGADDIIKQNGGIGLGESDRSTSVASSLSSTASEETMGVVAGYLARMSQDVSVLRLIQTQFVNESWPSYLDICTRDNNSLTSIDNNTRAIMIMMRDGNGEMYNRISNISRRLDNFATGVDRIYIR